MKSQYDMFKVVPNGIRYGSLLISDEASYIKALQVHLIPFKSYFNYKDPFDIKPSKIIHGIEYKTDVHIAVETNKVAPAIAKSAINGEWEISFSNFGKYISFFVYCPNKGGFAVVEAGSDVKQILLPKDFNFRPAFLELGSQPVIFPVTGRHLTSDYKDFQLSVLSHNRIDVEANSL